MGKQYPRLEICLLWKSAASLAQCWIMIWCPELEEGFQDGSLGFQDMNRQHLSRGPLQKVPSTKNTNTTWIIRERGWFCHSRNHLFKCPPSTLWGFRVDSFVRHIGRVWHQPEPQKSQRKTFVILPSLTLFFPKCAEMVNRWRVMLTIAEEGLWITSHSASFFKSLLHYSVLVIK